MTLSTLLGGMSASAFMRRHWQKKPLLVRGAIPGFAPLLSRDDLFAMATRDDMESRLVTHFDRRWNMDSGPFDKLPSLRRKSWTLLLQGVNLHHDAADELLRRFRFIPDARLDDLMISFATDEGGVGPHFDSYDVFLLQAHGRRRWRISAQKDLSLVENLPLKILKRFTSEMEFILEPGDMLYLPPHYAHEGVAIGECMTYSIGFRAPSYQELGEGFLHFLADQADLPGRYADPERLPSATPARLDPLMLDKVDKVLRKIRFTKEDVAIFLGEYLSDPKPTLFFDRPARPLNFDRFIAKAEAGGIKLSRKTQMLYTAKHIFCNGASYGMPRGERKILAALADRRYLDGTTVAAASDDIREALHEWYTAGWLLPIALKPSGAEKTAGGKSAAPYQNEKQ